MKKTISIAAITTAVLSFVGYRLFKEVTALKKIDFSFKGFKILSGDKDRLNAVITYDFINNHSIKVEAQNLFVEVFYKNEILSTIQSKFIFIAAKSNTPVSFPFSVESKALNKLVSNIFSDDKLTIKGKVNYHIQALGITIKGIPFEDKISIKDSLMSYLSSYSNTSTNNIKVQ